jgi:hypothetical protein
MHSCVPITGSIQSLGYVGVAGKQHSIQKVVAADLPSPGGGATNAESANAADPVTVAAKTMKMTIRVSSIIIKNNNSSNSGALSTAPGAYADTEPVLGPVTEPLDPANKTKKRKRKRSWVSSILTNTREKVSHLISQEYLFANDTTEPLDPANKTRRNEKEESVG